MAKPKPSDVEMLNKLRAVEEQAAKQRKALGAEVIERPPLPPRPNVWYKPDVPIDFDDLIEANYEKSVAECVAEIPRDLSEKYAKTWAWNKSDELAIRNGCRFDLKRAMHFAYTLRNHLVLWEGRWNGEPFILRTWQPECLLRIFGWVRPHEDLVWNRRFSKSSVWTCKKHGKSPTGAAVGIYLWKFDGTWDYGADANEPIVGGGQHVFCMAKNGKQAGIVWKHAVRMARRSPMLKALIDCNDIRVVDAWAMMEDKSSFSEFTKVTGETREDLETAEGLNAAGLLVDEAHVVSDAQVEVMTDAGTSQEQFLWFQFSTYGNSEGYGKKDLEYGKNVVSGEIEDDGMFFHTYEAPQDTSDEDCGKEEVWRLANPNLGFTVSSLKFRESYERAKDDPVQFSGWKRRRLNIWQRVANPMFTLSVWEQFGHEFDSKDLPEEIKGVGGGTGLDLAATEDWASIGHAFDREGKLNIWGRVWVSEGWIDANRHRAPFEKWANDGWIKVHEGDALDFDVIQEETLEFLRWTRSPALGYDKQFGMQMAQNLQKKMPQVGIYKFSQSVESYAVGTAELMAAVQHDRLRHPANPAIDWQAAHVMAKTIGEQHKPVKPESDGKPIPWRKIDTIQAMVMAIDVKRWLQPPVMPYVGVV